MKPALPPFSKHYVSYMFYCIYILCWAYTWYILSVLKQQEDGGVFLLACTFISIMFIIISILNAIFRSKDQRKFYLWLIPFIILPPTIVFILLSIFR